MNNNTDRSFVITGEVALQISINVKSNSKEALIEDVISKLDSDNIMLDKLRVHNLKGRKFSLDVNEVNIEWISIDEVYEGEK